MGWHRYAFEPFALGLIFSGVPLVWAFRYIRGFKHGLEKSSWRIYLSGLAITSFLILSTLWGIFSGYSQIYRILFAQDKSPQLFAAYIQDNIAPDALIESWEWEIDALTIGWTYHHPENIWVDRKTAETQFNDVPVERYAPLALNPLYLIDGPFSKFTEMYSDVISDDCCVRVVDIGNYTLYKVKDNKK